MCEKKTTKKIDPAQKLVTKGLAFFLKKKL